MALAGVALPKIALLPMVLGVMGLLGECGK